MANDSSSTSSYSTKCEELSSDEYSYDTSQRNLRKRFWKGNESTTKRINHESKFEKSEYEQDQKICSSSPCPFVKERNRNAQRISNRNQTTIKLMNVPPGMNNILDLYHCFSQFGVIKLIQTQRNNNPMSAVLSFRTPEAALNALKNANKPFERNLENLINDLIRKKTQLLSRQLDFLREINEKIRKPRMGNEEQEILLKVLRRVQQQIYENQESIEYSLKQKAAYFTHKNKVRGRTTIKQVQPKCPPWIKAYNSSIAKSENSDAENSVNTCCISKFKYEDSSDSDSRSSSSFSDRTIVSTVEKNLLIKPPIEENNFTLVLKL